MQDVVHAGSGLLGDGQFGQVAFDELGRRNAFEITAFARDQAVHDADAMTAPHQLFREMRSDEAGTAGYQIRSHGVSVQDGNRP